MKFIICHCLFHIIINHLIKAFYLKLILSSKKKTEVIHLSFFFSESVLLKKSLRISLFFISDVISFNSLDELWQVDTKSSSYIFLSQKSNLELDIRYWFQCTFTVSAVKKSSIVSNASDAKDKQIYFFCYWQYRNVFSFITNK